MTIPVPIDAVAEELDCLPDDARVYVNRETGEVLTVLNSDLEVVEEGNDGDGFEWEWPDEELPKLRGIAERNGTWVTLPDKREIHEWTLMQAFADEQLDPLASNLSRAIRAAAPSERSERSSTRQVARRTGTSSSTITW